MIATEINPGWLDASAYVDFLNLGFPGQWNAASLDFYAGREFLGRAPDIGVRAERERILAGVSYCYRQIRLGAARPLDVCVLSAGTTRPGERGRGHYRELLDAGFALCREKAYAAILGFVTRDNGSARGLERLGAYSIPSYYIVSGARRPSSSTASPRRPPASRPADAGRLPEVLSCWNRPLPADRVHFHYPGPEDWAQQFIRRAHPVRAVRLGHDVLALLETVGDTDRLQWLGCPHDKVIASVRRLAAASAASRRRFFMYTLDPLLAAAAARSGLGIRAGLVMLLPVDRGAADWSALAAAKWCLQSGDRL
jgi:hypothetical protein